ncbi:MAG TPA: MFS transporter [Pseudolabrys sp.]|nr:MFS transporter [Pseudolabrys sp.]
MTEATELTRPSGSDELRLVGGISAAHFLSHYYILLLPPLFLFVRDEYNVSFTALSFALAVFNIVSAALQTPAGFLVDRISARVVLVSGIVLGALAFMIVALVHSYWLLVVMFALAGLGNTVYHPANYALLARHVSDERMGPAYSVHSFAGFAGTAAAPVTLLLLESLWGWRGAVFASAMFGFAVAALVLMIGDAPQVSKSGKSSGNSAPTAWRLLLSGPILRNLLFYLLLAILSSGMNGYSVVALNALHATPLAVANTALTCYLTATAIGVLLGGFVVMRTSRHVFVAAASLGIAALITLSIGLFDLGTLLLILTMSVSGLFTGLLVPSRDLIVRAATPPGSFGKVFGFVSSGFNLGGIIGPIIFGLLMDHGHPQFVFVLVAAACALCIVTVAGGTRRE